MRSQGRATDIADFNSKTIIRIWRTIKARLIKVYLLTRGFTKFIKAIFHDGSLLLRGLPIRSSAKKRCEIKGPDLAALTALHCFPKTL